MAFVELGKKSGNKKTKAVKYKKRIKIVKPAGYHPKTGVL
jgi:hypothetical protein